MRRRSTSARRNGLRRSLLLVAIAPSLPSRGELLNTLPGDVQDCSRILGGDEVVVHVAAKGRIPAGSVTSLSGSAVRS